MVNKTESYCWHSAFSILCTCGESLRRVSVCPVSISASPTLLRPITCTTCSRCGSLCAPVSSCLAAVLPCSTSLAAARSADGACGRGGKISACCIRVSSPRVVGWT